MTEGEEEKVAGADSVIEVENGGRLCFRLLGPFEIGQHKTTVRLAAKPRVLLAALLLQVGQRVSTDSLADIVWNDTPPVKPQASIHSYVMRVRKALMCLSFDPKSLYTVRGGYILDVDPMELDVTWFNLFRERATGARNVSDERAEMLSLRSALDLWRGNALEDIPSDVLQEGPARRLDEARLALLQRRLELDLDAGRHDEVRPMLIELAAAHPLNEAFWRLLTRTAGSHHRMASSPR